VVNREAVPADLVVAGKAHGMKLVGGRTYSSNTIESGWIPSPLPGVYTGDLLQPYRNWLTANHCEAKASVSGSYVPEGVKGYYLNPWDLRYGPFVKFDHDFIGREALEKMATQPRRKKVTLAMLDAEFAAPGTEVDYIWGEPDGGTSKPTVEKHRQVTIKAVVAPVPYSEVGRTSYASSWRTETA
jgi:glycine cleavage system aminomethyltransferase T